MVNISLQLLSAVHHMNIMKNMDNRTRFHSCFYSGGWVWYFNGISVI